MADEDCINRLDTAITDFRHGIEHLTDEPGEAEADAQLSLLPTERSKNRAMPTLSDKVVPFNGTSSNHEGQPIDVLGHVKA